MALDLALTAGLALLMLAVGAVATAGRAPASPVIYIGAALACALLALAGLWGLASEPATRLLPAGLPWLGMNLRLDGLSAFFLTLIGIGGGLASLYAIGYGAHEEEPARTLPFYPAFLAAMALVVLADDAFTFLFAWELMSVLSWALVLARHREAEAREAGFVYLVMAAFGTFALLLALGLLAGGEGGYAFDAIRSAERSPAVAVAVLALMLVGAGSKAGLVPLHVWLPLAHPAAPSHVSALMSGVMTKVALYGFIRVIFDLVGPLPWWTSPAVISLGAATAVLGILNANVERDVKRILAWSTIENIGVIFVGLGLALAFRSNGLQAGAALALTAALFHAFNHMAFKSLLFMGAGAVLHATGTRDLDRLGGLIHRMPKTAVLMLIAVTAISALPPLNGFASEWLLFQAVLASPALPEIALQIIIPAAGGLLALAAALAAAAFVRLYGLGFLGRPRGPAAAEAHETDRFSLAAMALLALICVAAGLFPGVVVDALAPAVHPLAGAGLPEQTAQPWLTLIPIAPSRGTYNGLLVFLFSLVSAFGAAALVHRFGSRALRRAPAWDCGFPNADPATQYSGGSFAQPIARVLGPVLLRSRETVSMPGPGDLSPARHEARRHDLIWEGLYLPLAHAVWRATLSLNRLQFLTIRRYLSLVVFSLVGLLLAVALWS